MGAYLSSPITEKETQEGENACFRYGVAAMQGWRVTMEDAHVTKLRLNGQDDAAFFGVFDGHGGAQVARFCAKHMPDIFISSEHYRNGDIKQALISTYLAIDEMLRKPEHAEELNRMKAKSSNSNSNGMGLEAVDQQESVGSGSYDGPAAGCTAVVAVVLGHDLYVANAGDSRCVLCHGNITKKLTVDHKPTNPGEEKRIVDAGGFVTEGRVNGCLNLSRAIGDMNYKQGKNIPPEKQVVTALPDVEHVKLDSSSRFLILACDGIWDILSHDDAVAFVNEKAQEGKDARAICEAMCDHCLAPSTEGIGKGCDNMSAMVVFLSVEP